MIWGPSFLYNALEAHSYSCGTKLTLGILISSLLVLSCLNQSEIFLMHCTCNEGNVAKHREGGLSWPNKLINKLTYMDSILVKKGNKISNWLRLVSPCTNTTGKRNEIVKSVHRNTTTNLEIHLRMNDSEKKGQYTSRGSGASSVIQWVGLTDCFKWKAVAAPKRDLKNTKAARDSLNIEQEQRLVDVA